ncbi:MAG: TolC family protein [Chitinophagaceae bacterium]
MRRYVLPLLLLAAIPGRAQKVLSLEEAIASALQNNYDILLSRNDSAVAALDYSFRNSVFYPRVNGAAGGTWNNNDQRQTLADGSKREQNNLKSNNYNISLNVNWTLFDGLKMFVTRDKVTELIRLGELGIKEQVINTVASVITTYYNVVRQKQMLKAIEEQMTLSQERVKLAQYKLDIGVGAKPDVLQSKVDHNAQKALRLEQLTTIAQLKEQLNQLMNVREAPPYDVSDSIPLNTGLSLGDIQAGIENSNPTLQITRKNIDIAGLTLKERKAERWPTVALNTVYNYSRSKNKAVINPFSPLFNQSRGYNYGFTAAFPIFNNHTVKRQIRQAELAVNFQRMVLDNQKSQLNLAVVNAFLEYEQQKKALALEEENIVLARENVDIVFQVYKLSSTTLIQLKEAEKSLQDAYTRLITARYNTKLAETELLRLRGELVK